jgi:hypothetical protein
LGPSSGDSFALLNRCIQGQRRSEKLLKTGSNIITDMLNKEPKQPVGDIFKNRFIEAKDNLEQKIKKMSGQAWV